MTSTIAEVIGLDILAPRQPKLYSQVVNGLGYTVNPSTNIVSSREGSVDESCRPDATGRQICLKPFMYPTDVINVSNHFKMSVTFLDSFKEDII